VVIAMKPTCADEIRATLGAMDLHPNIVPL
jgi:hypothetical protein